MEWRSTPWVILMKMMRNVKFVVLILKLTNTQNSKLKSLMSYARRLNQQPPLSSLKLSMSKPLMVLAVLNHPFPNRSTRLTLDSSMMPAILNRIWMKASTPAPLLRLWP